MWPLIGAAVGVAGALSWAVRGRSSQVFAPSVWKLPAGKRQIALTFDDGPSESTPAILDLLDRHGAKATFFVCGANAERLPDILKAIAKAGHEIGNHTWSHPRLDFQSVKTMRQEIGRTQALVQSITGIAPRLFRAPYGVRWVGLRSVQAEFRLTGVMWSVIGKDWILPADAVSKRTLAAASDGGILCLHDGRVLEKNPNVAPTVDAIREILPRLHNRHLSITSVSAMLY